MKKLNKAILSTLPIIVLLSLNYLGLSYVTLELNPLKWSELMRAIYFISSVLLSMVGFMSLVMLIEEK